MPGTTTRGTFPYPLGGDPPDTDGATRALAEALADTVALDAQGTFTARPAAGVRGRYYAVTEGTENLGVVYRDSGTAWDTVGVSRAGGSTITASGPAVKGLVVKGASGQTANPLEVQNNAGTVLASVLPGGAVTGAAFGANGFITGQNAQIHSTPSAPDAKGLVVRGAAGQTANLAEFQDSTGAVLAKFDAAGRATTPQLGVGPVDPLGVGRTVLSAPADAKVLVVRGAAGQTANLAEFQNSAGTVLAAVDAAGRPVLTATSPSAGAVAGYFHMVFNGTVYRVPFHNA